MAQPVSGPSWVMERVFDDPYQQTLPGFMAFVLRKPNISQIGAIWQAGNGSEAYVRRDAPKKSSFLPGTTGAHVKTMKATVPHHQHIRSDRAQHPQTTFPFADLIRPDTCITDGMRSIFAQIDTVHLWKSTDTARTHLPTNLPDVADGFCDNLP